MSATLSLFLACTPLLVLPQLLSLQLDERDLTIAKLAAAVGVVQGAYPAAATSPVPAPTTPTVSPSPPSTATSTTLAAIAAVTPASSMIPTAAGAAQAAPVASIATVTGSPVVSSLALATPQPPASVPVVGLPEPRWVQVTPSSLPTHAQTPHSPPKQDTQGEAAGHTLDVQQLQRPQQQPDVAQVGSGVGRGLVSGNVDRL